MDDYFEFEDICYTLPDYILTNLCSSINPDIAITSANELDRRSPEPMPTQYDGEGNEIKSEVIGCDEKGREIWLEIWTKSKKLNTSV